MRSHARRQFPAGAAAIRVLLSALLLGLAAGCSQSRAFTIYAKPANARLIIDGQDRGPGPITHEFRFSGPSDVHHVRAVAPGYETRTEDIWSDTPASSILVELRPMGRKVIVSVEPVSAILKVNGAPLRDGLTEEADFTLDPSSPNRQYVVTAEREGYETATRTLRGNDPPGYYPLVLKPLEPGTGAGQAVAQAEPPPRQPTDTMHPAPPVSGPMDSAPTARPGRSDPAPVAPKPSLARAIAIRTDPPDARAAIYIGDQKWGDKAVDLEAFEFRRDAVGRPLPEQVRAVAPGYEGGTVTLRWEDNRREYVIPLGNRQKQVVVITDPPGAAVQGAGQTLERATDGSSRGTLKFPPTDPPGRPTVFTALVSGGDQFEPREVPIAWDEGQERYTVKLTPARTTTVALLRPRFVWREPAGWQAEAQRVATVALRDTGEGNGRPAAVRFSDVGGQTDAVAVSPDGSLIVCTVLAESAGGSLASRVRLFHADGKAAGSLPDAAGPLDLTPSFTPDGRRLYFSSSRGGGINVWSAPVSPDGPAMKQVSASESATLWPSIDSNPQPRLFYEAVTKQGESEVHVVEMSAAARTNVTLAQGSRPRPSPRADAVLFTAPDPATGNRDLYLISDTPDAPLGGRPVNLTNTPDVDDCDPVWARNGSRIAFASNAGADDTGRKNYDLYVMTLSERKQTRLTHNGSWDDSPAFDPGGRKMYFRSNRGGQWAVWTIPVP